MGIVAMLCFLAVLRRVPKSRYIAINCRSRVCVYPHAQKHCFRCIARGFPGIEAHQWRCCWL